MVTRVHEHGMILLYAKRYICPAYTSNSQIPLVTINIPLETLNKHYISLIKSPYATRALLCIFRIYLPRCFLIFFHKFVTADTVLRNRRECEEIARVYTDVGGEIYRMNGVFLMKKRGHLHLLRNRGMHFFMKWWFLKCDSAEACW